MAHLQFMRSVSNSEARWTDHAGIKGPREIRIPTELNSQKFCSINRVPMLRNKNLHQVLRICSPACTSLHRKPNSKDRERALTPRKHQSTTTEKGSRCSLLGFPVAGRLDRDSTRERQVGPWWGRGRVGAGLKSIEPWFNS